MFATTALLLLGSAATAVVAAPSSFGLQALVVEGGADMDPSINGYYATYIHTGAGLNAMTLEVPMFGNAYTHWCPNPTTGGLKPCALGKGAGMILDSSVAYITIPEHENKTTPVDFSAESGMLAGPEGDRFMACSGETLGNPTGYPKEILLSYLSESEEVLEGCADIRLGGFASESS